MNDGQQSLAEVKEELVDRIAGVKQELVDKIDAVDHKVDTVEKRLLDKIDAVDRKVDAVDRKVEALQGLPEELRATRTELTNLINATAVALERRLDKKLDRMDQKLDRMEDRIVKSAVKAAEAAADAAVERVIGTIWERSAYDASVLDDKLNATNRRLDEHVSNENIHLTPGSKR